jgi:hypothetical protein
MNAMLDARMATARIHGPALAAQGTAACRASITASSHGGFMNPFFAWKKS